MPPALSCDALVTPSTYSRACHGLDPATRHSPDTFSHAHSPFDAPSIAGYEYRFPFLEGGTLSEVAGVSVEDNAVHPLYLDIFPPSTGASLSFIGLPWKVVPFPQFEVQARVIARALSGAAPLPGRAKMEEAVEERRR